MAVTTKKKTKPEASAEEQPEVAPTAPEVTPTVGADQPAGAANAWVVTVKMDDGEVFEMPPMTAKEAQGTVNSLNRELGKVTLNLGNRVEIFNVKNVSRATASLVQLPAQEGGAENPAPAKKSKRK